MMSSFLGNKEDILKELNVDTKIGLTKEAQKLSLEKYGANSFTKEKSATLIQKILESVRLAPTDKNMQPQKIFVATTKESLKKLDTITPCRYNAPIVLIVCSNKNIAWTKDNYSTFEMDACIVATHMMLEATNQGLDNIWIEMFDKNKLKKEFNIPENIEPICLIPLGYKDQTFKGNPLHNNRKELKETVEFI